MYLEGDGQLARQKQRVDKAADINRLSFFILDFLGKIYHVLDSLSIVKLLLRYVMNHFKLKEK
jgi:hypothetical protein